VLASTDRVKQEAGEGGAARSGAACGFDIVQKRTVPALLQRGAAMAAPADFPGGPDQGWCLHQACGRTFPWASSPNRESWGSGLEALRTAAQNRAGSGARISL